MCSKLCYITQEEKATIIANMKYHYEEEFRCHYPDRFISEKQKSYHHKQSFCFNKIKEGKIPSYKHQYQDIKYKTCVCSFIDNGVNKLLELEIAYKNHGILPFSPYMYNIEGDNNIINQPAKLFQCFGIIRDFITRKEEEIRKKQEMEAKVKSKR